MHKSIKFFLLILVTFILHANTVSAGYSFDYGGSSGGTTQTSSHGHTMASGKYLTIGVGLKYSLVYVDASTMKLASSYVEVYKNSNYTQFYKKLQNGTENVKGSISTGTYSHNKHSWEVKVTNNKWYFNNSINPNNTFGFVIDSNSVYSKLNSDTTLFYEIVANLINKNDYVRTAVLKNSSNTSLTSTELQQIVTDTSNKYSDEIEVLQNYIVIIEPLYGVQTGTTSHETYTLKALAKEYSEDKIGLQMAREDQMISNFTTSSEHGIIKKSSNSLAGLLDSYDGTGYFVASIAGTIKKCDPTKECCYNASGEYDSKKTGKTKNYKCPDGSLNADGITCNSTVISCKQTSDVLCPDGKTKPFEFNYMFLGSEKITNDYFNSNITTNYSGANDTFSDKTILENLVSDYNNKNNTNLSIKDIITVDKRIYEIDETNLKSFYQYLNKAFNNRSSGYYYNDPNNPLSYYIWHTYYSTIKHGKTVTLKETRNSLGINYNTFEKYTLYPDELVIEPYENSDGGYKFNIRRTMPILDNSNSLKKGDLYYSPAQYQIKYCITTEETAVQCNDEVTKAECSGTTGTTATFHESDDLAACTLPKNNHSGFTLIDSSSTVTDDNNSNTYNSTEIKSVTSKYCSVACKEDYDIEVPTIKSTKAGEYFVLDQYIPKITSKRTCVTSQVDYDKFDSNLTTLENNMKTSYDTWRDWVNINGSYSSANYSGGQAVLSTWSTERTCKCATEDDPGCTYTVTIYHYNITSGNGVNNSTNTTFSGRSGSSGGCGGSGNPNIGKESYDSYVYNNVKSSKTNYDNALDNYKKEINDYNKCFNWVDQTHNAKTVTGTDNSKKISNPVNINRKAIYDYEFIPNVIFNADLLTVNEDILNTFGANYQYKYKDNTFVATPYNYELSSNGTSLVDVDSTGRNTIVNYWSKGSSVSSKYDNYSSTQTKETKGSYGSLIGDNKLTRKIYSCSGDYCTSTVNYSFYSSSYIKRTEDISYTYHLPKIYTSIPDGTLSTALISGKDQMTLEDEAVPININTNAGDYDYTLVIGKIKDEIRTTRSSSNTDDDVDDRFSENAMTKKYTKGTDKYSEYVCYYNVTNDIYTPPADDSTGFKFFYRTVDLGNINPNGRTLGYNWNNAKADVVIARMAETNTDYQKLTGVENIDNKITNDKTTDVYSFTLTPSIMKTIREYNKEQNASDSGYSDWTLSCKEYLKDDSTNPINSDDLTNISVEENGYHCSSPFLKCLASQGTNCDTSLSLSSSQISSLKSSKNEYTDDDLEENITKLIQKQNTLDKNY